MDKLPAELLKIAGEALYGVRWQSRLARDLGMSGRNLRYVIAGKHGGPFELAERLAGLLRHRAQGLAAAASQIEFEAQSVRDRFREEQSRQASPEEI